MQIGLNRVRDRRWNRKAAETNQFANGNDLSESLSASRRQSGKGFDISPMKKTEKSKQSEYEAHADSLGGRKVAGKAGECVGAGSMKGTKWRRCERIG